MKVRGKHILIAGGGTGGHLFPAIAVGQWLSEQPEVNTIFYIGSKFGIEAHHFKKLGHPYQILPVRGLQRGFTPEATMKNFLLPGRLLKSWLITRKVFKKVNPDVVLGTGGYASAIPLRVAVSEKIPIVLQEQNSYPGLTTRAFSDKAQKICLGFLKANEYLKNRGVFTGNPVRDGIDRGNREQAAAIFDLDMHKKTIFLFGGSQGSLFLNRMMSTLVSSTSYAGEFQILWQTGPRSFEQFRNYDTNVVRVVPFIDNMQDAYSLADLVISRAGAITLSEIALCHLPSILIPLPSSAGDHQIHNANYFREAGASIVWSEQELKPEGLFEAVTDLLGDQDKITRMGVNAGGLSVSTATEKIGQAVLEAARA